MQSKINSNSVDTKKQITHSPTTLILLAYPRVKQILKAKSTFFFVEPFGNFDRLPKWMYNILNL